MSLRLFVDQTVNILSFKHDCFKIEFSLYNWIFQKMDFLKLDFWKTFFRKKNQ